jgi:hypothetical protein
MVRLLSIATEHLPDRRVCRTRDHPALANQGMGFGKLSFPLRVRQRELRDAGAQFV